MEHQAIVAAVSQAALVRYTSERTEVEAKEKSTRLGPLAIED